MKKLFKIHEKAWLKQHSSAFFVFSLFLIAIIFLFSGYYIQFKAHPICKMIGNILMQLSGASLAAAIATIFLNFSDIKNYIASMVTSIISDGDFVKLLSYESKNMFHNKLIKEKLDYKVISLEPSLFNHLQNILEECLSVLHAYNYTVQEVISKHDKIENMIFKEVSISFRLNSRHLIHRDIEEDVIAMY